MQRLHSVWVGFWMNASITYSKWNSGTETTSRSVNVSAFLLAAKISSISLTLLQARPSI